MTGEAQTSGTLLAWLSQATQELGQKVKERSLPRETMREARKLLQRTWVLENDEDPNPDELREVLQAVETILYPRANPHHFNRWHFARLQQLEPRWIRCVTQRSPRIVANSRRAERFVAIRDARVEAIWALLSKKGESPVGHEPQAYSSAYAFDDFHVVTKKGRS